jgi:succinoglycan biosynthesis protein ExoO
MTSAPYVSVIIPAYNSGIYLERAVKSVLAQTAPFDASSGRVEIVVVDDASSDDTFERLKALSQQHPHITALRNDENLGPAASRNRAIAAARGDWIAVLDADDAYLPSRLARLVEAAEDGKADMIADLPIFFDLLVDERDAQQLPSDGQVTLVTLGDMMRPDPKTKLDLGLLKPMFHRRLVNAGMLSYSDMARHGEDWLLYVDLLRRGRRVMVLREGLYLFSTRIGSKSGAYSPGSMTQVDYPAIAQMALSMRDRMATEGDLTPQIEADLNCYVQRALRNNRIYGWTLLRRGEGRRLVGWLWANRRNRLDLLLVLWRKLRGQRGLPS